MKRKLLDHDASTTLHSPIQVKEEDSPLPISHNGKQKRNNASRTGTACDRCRIRKMRCDDNPDGCGSCRQAQAECKTTDRITGKATGRGYIDDLESRLSRLEIQNQDLRAQVVSLGGQLKSGSYQSLHGSTRYVQPPNGHLSEGTDRYATHRPAPDNGYYTGGDQDLPHRKSSSGNNYFGISSGNSLLSSVRGTSMNVLGMEIDLTGYLSADVDEPPSSSNDQPVYNKSYRSFIQSAFGLGPKLENVALPPRSEGLQYAELFLRITNPFVPLVHKPTFLRLFARIYDEPQYELSAAETVTVHASLAIAYCQTASRGATNPQHRMDLESATNFHYHYALGFFPRLMASHTLADVQALGLLCVFLRNCPKPGASWMLTSITLDLALELGLHRSAKHWAPSVKRNMIEIEMRKRVFWSVNWIHVLIGGALGRPMALQAGDWDVEIPEAVDDELLSEDGLDTTRTGRCEFLAGIQNFKIIPIYMDLYNIVYAVGDTPHNYEDTVRNLERRLQQWHAQWPTELVNPSGSAPNEIRSVHIQYLNLWSCHVRLLLRHPSLSSTTSPQFNAESLTKCLETSNTLLKYVKILQTNRGLDVTWQTSALFVLAIATTLYGRWERRSHLTLQEFEHLKKDMSDWLSIISDMDDLLGARGHLMNSVRTIVDTTLENLSQELIHKAAPKPSLPSYPPPPQQNSDYRPPYQRYPPLPDSSQSKEVESPYLQNMTHYNHPRTTYPPPPLTSQNSTASAPPAYMNAYSEPSYHNNVTAGDMYPAPGSPTSWQKFTGSMAPSWVSPSGEYMTSASASALMQMGGARDGGRLQDGGEQQRSNSIYVEPMSWPMSLYQPDGVSQ